MDFNVDAALKAASEHLGGKVEKFRHEGHDVPVLIVPQKHVAIDPTPFAKAFEAIQPAPFRRRGTFEAETLASLMDWAMQNCPGLESVGELPSTFETPADNEPPVERPKRKTLVVYAEGFAALGKEWKHPDLSLTIFGNYSTPEKPGWHDFKGHFKYTVSVQWADWASKNGVLMTQTELAAFIEDRMGDLGYRGEEPLSEIAAAYMDSFVNGKDATPAEIIRLSRGLEMYANFKVAEARNYQTGEGALTFSEEHSAADGKRLEIPPLFHLRIPVFHDSSPVLVPVRLRYRMVPGKGVMWFYELLRPELLVGDMFLASLDLLRQSGHVTIMGTPEVPDQADPVEALVVNAQGQGGTVAL